MSIFSNIKLVNLFLGLRLNYGSKIYLTFLMLLVIQYFIIRIRRIHMFLGLLSPDPDPLVRGTDPALYPDPDPSIISQK
jgi:hypothetical protein